MGIARIDGDPVIVGFLKNTDPVKEEAGRPGSARTGAPVTARYVIVVNRNPARRGRVVVEMQPGWKAFEVYKFDGITETPVNSPLHVGLEPGDGRLFRLAPE